MNRLHIGIHQNLLPIRCFADVANIGADAMSDPIIGKWPNWYHILKRWNFEAKFGSQEAIFFLHYWRWQWRYVMYMYVCSVACPDLAFKQGDSLCVPPYSAFTPQTCWPASGASRLYPLVQGCVLLSLLLLYILWQICVQIWRRKYTRHQGKPR